jgi:hypothetical protein
VQNWTDFQADKMSRMSRQAGSVFTTIVQGCEDLNDHGELRHNVLPKRARARCTTCLRGPRCAGCRIG